MVSPLVLSCLRSDPCDICRYACDKDMPKNLDEIEIRPYPATDYGALNFGRN